MYCLEQYHAANDLRVLQVCCQHFIKRHQYETSYSCLAKRAAKTNNVWNQLVRKGCKARRLCMFGEFAGAFVNLMFDTPRSPGRESVIDTNHT